MADASSRNEDARGEPSRTESSLAARLSSYRPVFDRVLFGVALLGVLVAVHLLIQQGRGFDRGCLGFSSPAAVEATFDCNLVTESSAGKLLGVSNAWWGIGFYLAVAGLSAAAAFRQRFPFAAARAVLIGGGLLYSAYLTYHQFAGIGALCALCLTSAAIALTLFIVQAVMLARSGPAPSRSSTSTSSRSSSAMASASRRPALWGAAALALVVLIGADVAYFSSLESGAPEPARAEAAAGSQAPARSASAGQPATPADTTQDPTGLPPGCGFASDAPTIETSRLVDFTDPVYGNSDAEVTVVEFFDPNCPHCKTFDVIMKDLMAEYGDDARFVYKPIWLWQYSINQIAALHAAQQQGQFDEMLQAQYANQQPGRGLTNDELVPLARQAGVNPDAMLSQIRQQSHRQKMMRDRQLAQEAGLQGTPAVSIGGRLVARAGKTPDCLSALIDRAVEEAETPQTDS